MRTFQDEYLKRKTCLDSLNSFLLPAINTFDGANDDIYSKGGV